MLIMKNLKNELKLFLTTDNNSGYKTKELFLSIKQPEYYSEVTNHSLVNNFTDLPFKEQLYLYINDLKEIPKCKNCNKPLKFKRSINEGYNEYCSLICTNTCEDHINQIKKTNNVKYGGNAPMVSKEIQKKVGDTNIEKYGVDNIFKKRKYIEDKVLVKYGNTVITKTDYHKNKMQENYEEKYKSYKIKKIGELVEFLCETCNKTSTHENNSFMYRIKNEITLCKHCVPPYQSMIEIELENFLIEHEIKYKKHDRKLIKPKEIDFHLIDYNIGIELCGLYFHSELFIDKNYHHDKWFDCKEKNINLIQIFEDEWKFKKEIVKNIILSKLNKNLITLYGRKCNIIELTTNDYKNFINDNHIQGFVGAKVRLGLMYNEILVGVMSFSSLRKFMNQSKINGEYEMIRMCTKSGYKIIGGSKKLLSYFEKEYNPSKIISYCDLRYFTGESYSSMNFILENKSKPNYFYFKPNDTKKRYHRFNFRKDVLVKEGFSPNKTELEIMKELGYLKIYDVGCYKFTKSYNK